MQLLTTLLEDVQLWDRNFRRLMLDLSAHARSKWVQDKHHRYIYTSMQPDGPGLMVVRHANIVTVRLIGDRSQKWDDEVGRTLKRWGVNLRNYMILKDPDGREYDVSLARKVVDEDGTGAGFTLNGIGA